jgi:serine/threonine-protein kinase RsbW
MNETARIQISAGLEDLAVIRHFVTEKARNFFDSQDALEDLVLAVDEAATNVIVHGYRGGPGPLEVEIWQEADALVVAIRDKAPSFDPSALPPPDLTIPLSKRRLGGLGAFLMKQCTDEIRHRVLPEGGNELVLVKKCTSSATKKEHDNDESVR